LLLPDLLASFRDRWMQTRGVALSFMRHQESLIGRIVRTLSITAFFFYLVWNAVWIVKGRIPPSILRAVIGLPCPTTGGYRSFLALLRGEFVQSFLFNPLMPVYVLLFLYSMAVLLRQLICRKRLALSPFIGRMWGCSLLLGWVAKFVLGRQYW